MIFWNHYLLVEMLLHQGLLEIHTKCPKLSKFLSSILKCMFSKGEIPLQWQSAREIYIPKSKTPPGNLISDFQPIAFLNVEGKLFFSLISKRLESHLLQSNKIINVSVQKAAWKDSLVVGNTYPWSDLYWKRPGLRNLQLHQYTVSEFHFRSVNYMVVAKIHKNLKQNKPFWWGQ